jgi:DNA-binding NarL/FixJ family response regulator
MEKRAYILADNQAITRTGVASLLYELDAKSSVVTAGSCRELLEQLKVFPAAVVVLDYTLFDFASPQQLINMKAGAKASSWLLFCDEPSETFLRQVLQSDPSISVVMKHDGLEQITEALRTVSSGGVYLCEVAASISKGSVPKPAVPDKLTATERMILRDIASGKMTKEIAWEKNLSFHTVNTHRKNIFRKLEISTVHEAIKYAIRAGLVDLAEYSI